MYCVQCLFVLSIEPLGGHRGSMAIQLFQSRSTLDLQRCTLPADFGDCPRPGWIGAVNSRRNRHVDKHYPEAPLLALSNL